MVINESVRTRFWSKVAITSEDDNDCWEWQAALFKGTGYGQFNIRHYPYRAHRVSYTMEVSIIPKGLCVCHKCDNRLCVRPSHLFLGLHKDNILDAKNKGHMKAKYSQRGEGSPVAKLKEHDVRDIRRLSDLYSTRKLAKIFGIGQTTVRHITAKRTWRHLA